MMIERYYESILDQQKLSYTYHNEKHFPILFVIFHGMAEHKERYDGLAKWIIELGYGVLLIDHRGHGKSLYDGYLKGHFADENGYFKNLEDLHGIVSKHRFDQQALVVFGHSMGSLFARSYLKKYGDSVNGCILSGSPDEAPFVNLIYPVSKGLSRVMGHQKEAKILTKTIYSGFNAKINPAKTAYDWLSYNVKNVEAYMSDELCGFNLTFGGFRDLMQGIQDVYKTHQKTNHPNTPILMISGKEDPCQLPKGLKHAKSVLFSLGYLYIDCVEIEHARHEWLNEENHESGVKEIQNWICQHFAQ